MPPVLLVGWLVLLSTQSVEVVFVSSLGLTCLFLVWQVPHLARVFVLLVPFVAMAAVGAISGLASHEAEPWAFFRDVAYFSKAPLVLFASFCIAAKVKDFDRVLNAVFYASLILALYYVARYVALESWDMSRRTLRITVGRAYYLTAFGLLIALLRPSVIGGPALWRRSMQILGIATISLAAILSTSRGILLCPALFLLCAMLRQMRLPFRPFLLAAVAFVTFFSIPPLYGALGDLATVTEHSTLNEVFSSEFGSQEQILTAFRAYEAHLAWQQFAVLDVREILFGKGFGSLVELTMAVELGISAETQTLLTAVPVTHISIMTSLMKFGVVGTILYMLSIVVLASPRHGRADSFTININRTAVLLALFIVWIFQGYFSPLDIMNVALAIIGMSHFAIVSSESEDQTAPTSAARVALPAVPGAIR